MPTKPGLARVVREGIEHHAYPLRQLRSSDVCLENSESSVGLDVEVEVSHPLGARDALDARDVPGQRGSH